MAADLQAVMIEKINGRLSKVPAKNRTAFTPPHISCPGNIIQGKFFFIVLADIGNHGSLHRQVRTCFFPVLSWDRSRKDALLFQDMSPELAQDPNDLQLISGFALLLQLGDAGKRGADFPAEGIFRREVQVLQSRIFQHRKDIFVIEQRIFRDQVGWEDCTRKEAFLFVCGKSIVHLPGVYHQAVLLFQVDPFPADEKIHLPFQDIDPLQISVPVAQGAHLRIAGEIALMDIQRNSQTVVM